MSFAVETPPKEEALYKRPRSDDGCESAQATNDSQPPGAKHSRIAADSEPCSSTAHDSGSQVHCVAPSNDVLMMACVRLEVWWRVDNHLRGIFASASEENCAALCCHCPQGYLQPTYPGYTCHI